MITVRVVRNMTGLICTECGGIIGAKDVFILSNGKDSYHHPPCAEKHFTKDLLKRAFEEIPHELSQPVSEKTISVPRE